MFAVLGCYAVLIGSYLPITLLSITLLSN